MKGKKFNFIDVALMLIGFVISITLYGNEGGLAIFYGWFFATGILFAIRISFKENGFTLDRFKRKNS